MVSFILLSIHELKREIFLRDKPCQIPNFKGLKKSFPLYFHACIHIFCPEQPVTEYVKYPAKAVVPRKYSRISYQASIQRPACWCIKYIDFGHGCPVPNVTVLFIMASFISPRLFKTISNNPDVFDLHSWSGFNNYQKHSLLNKV